MTTDDSTRSAELAEWILVAEDGTSTPTDENTARREVAEEGWTINGSPVHTAFTRPDSTSLYQEVGPSLPPESRAT